MDGEVGGGRPHETGGLEGRRPHTHVQLVPAARGHHGVRGEGAQVCTGAGGVGQLEGAATASAEGRQYKAWGWERVKLTIVAHTQVLFSRTKGDITTSASHTVRQ